MSERKTGWTFAKLLGVFKSNERPESLVQLLNDPILRSAIVAWPSVPIRITAEPNLECECGREADQWKWLWDHVEYDQPMFGIIANVEEHEVHKILIRLVGLRLIYPDGTIHKLAQQYLRSLIIQQLPSKPKSKSKESEGEGGE